MDGFNAAREGDSIVHTASEGWMIAGLIGGAILGAAAVVVTGGTALIAVSAAAAGATAAGGIGEVLGGMSWAPRHVTGKLIEGSPDVFINDRPAIRAHLSSGACEEHSGSLHRVAEGSSRVFINDWPAARNGDRLTCSAEIQDGSPNVFIGGSKYPTDDINPEIPGWINWVMLGVGVAAISVLASPAVALLSTLGGMGGGWGGNLLGGRFFGEGSDGQKWSMLLGGLVGGAAGGKGGARFDTWRNGKSIISDQPMSLADAVGQDRAEQWVIKGRELADQNAPHLSALLSDDQIGALHGYTTETGYRMINPALRGTKPITPELEAFARHTTDALNKLPAFEGETYRGINSFPKNVLDTYSVGNIVSDQGFMSTDVVQPFEGRIKLNIDGVSGRSIDFLSAFKTTETEVLYPPGIKFKVINRVDENGISIIDLKEVE